MWLLERVSVSMRISACSLANPAGKHVRHVVTSFVAPPSSTIFFGIISLTVHFLKKKKNVIGHKICVLIFSTTFA
jgi:hypothetical protein